MASVGFVVAAATAATAAVLRWAALHRLRDYAAARDVPIDQLDAVASAANPRVWVRPTHMATATVG